MNPRDLDRLIGDAHLWAFLVVWVIGVVTLIYVVCFYDS